MVNREVADALRALAEQNGGRLTPQQVVAAAKDKASPLHAYFTWNVKEAAEERWIDQARTLIRSVRVEVTTTEFSVKAPVFIRDPELPGNRPGYVSLGRLRNDEDLSREAIVREFSMAAAALSRAKAVAAALGMDRDVEEVHDKVVQLKERAQHASE